jgi:hypothetical protein
VGYEDPSSGLASGRVVPSSLWPSHSHQIELKTLFAAKKVCVFYCDSWFTPAV